MVRNCNNGVFIVYFSKVIIFYARFRFSFFIFKQINIERKREKSERKKRVQRNFELKKKKKTFMKINNDRIIIKLLLKKKKLANFLTLLIRGTRCKTVVIY